MTRVFVHRLFGRSWFVCVIYFLHCAGLYSAHFQEFTVMMTEPTGTLSAASIATGSIGPEIIRSQAIVIRNTFNEPIVLTVMIAPRMYHIYSIAIDPVEFRNALRQYGIDQVPQVNKINF